MSNSRNDWSQNSVRITGGQPRGSVRITGQQPRIIEQKTSNALLRDARVGVGSVPYRSLMRVFGTMIGGLWVGGTTYLTEDAITFQPNELNDAFHEGDSSVSIPLREVTHVRQRFGFISQIIDVSTQRRTLTIRCFGASAFAQLIQGQVAQQNHRAANHARR